MSEKVRDVIVIGAGISGLSAATLLKDNGLDVVVVEARNRVGGRTYTIKNSKVKYCDFGAAYVGRSQDRMFRLIKEFDLELYKVNEVEDLVHYKNGKRTQFRAGSDPPVGTFLDQLDLNNAMRLMDKMAEEIPTDAPWDAPHAREWDQMTFKEFVAQNTWTSMTRDFAQTFINMNVTSEPYEASLLWFLWYVKQCNGTRCIISTTNGGQEFKLVGGMQQISERLTDKLGSNRVLLNKPVVGITQTDNEVTVRALDGTEYRARHIIMALAPPMQHKIHYSPPLPPLRNQLNQRCPMGSVMKAIVYYQTPFWRSKGFCGSLIVEGLETEYPIEFTLDETKPDGTVAAIIGFIPADKCRRIHEMSKEERIAKITQCFAKAWDTDEALHPTHYEEYNWSGEQYSGGCYTTLCPPGFLTTFGRALRQPIGRMYFAGTETATYWSGYMEGGVQAGERAAREILAERGLISADQIWQIEPPSKEISHYYFKRNFWERNMPSVGCLFKATVLVATLSLAIAVPLVSQKFDIRLSFTKK